MKKRVNKSQINLRVRNETVKALEQLGEETHRFPGEVVDWLVSEAMERIAQTERQTKTVQEAIENVS